MKGNDSALECDLWLPQGAIKIPLSDDPFYMWTIVQAWEWLINVPILGFAFMVLAGLCVLILVLGIVAFFDPSVSD